MIIASLLITMSLFAISTPNMSVMAQAKDGTEEVTVTPEIPSSDSDAEETDDEMDTSDTDVSINEAEKPSGGGSVIESNNTTGDGKTFYTVNTKDEQVFYIIVDNNKASDNVYLLTDVTQEDLAKLVNQEEPIIQETPEKEPTKPSVAETEITEKQPEEAQTNYLPIILLAVVLIGSIGGAYYYFKVYKLKRDLNDAEDLEDFSFVDEVESYREKSQSDEMYDLEDDFEDDEFEEDDE
ncbi:CD1107 family mobile element protein [Listeria monocytogenes]|uniref:CD1107 family mobile element protein n=1 Tax=Listeria monocytogenes TaxID=1639 RepID=UPI00135A7CD4|nr:DUF4366 domain-containing protein [Listeria monocytogenes]